jgi:hypothetical protein
LKILQRKDELIAALQEQLKESTSIHVNRSQNHRDNVESTNLDAVSRIKVLERNLQDMQHKCGHLEDQLRSEEREHRYCRVRLRHAEEQSRSRHGHTAEESSELRSLREKTLDQAEQIEVQHD